MTAQARTAATMHALRVHGDGPGDGVVADRLPVPDPQPGQVQPGETLRVLGAGGGVGLAAVQVGRWLGARVLALVSTEARRAAARAAGAHEVIDGSSDWKDRVKALAGPAGVAVVFDPVGGDATDPAFRTLGWGGRQLVVGFAGGQIHALRSNLALVKGASLVGVDLRQAGGREPARIAAVQRDVLAAWAAGRLRPHIHAVPPVGRFAEAFARVRNRATLGRALLDFTGDDP